MRLYCENGIELYEANNLELLPKLDEKVNLVLTDPPYGIGYQNQYTSSKHEKMAGDICHDYSFWAKHCFNLMEDGSALLAYTNWSEYPDHFSQIKEVGFKMKEPLIIQKRPAGTTDLKGSFQSNSDWLLFGSKGRFIFKKSKLLRNKKAGVVPNAGRKPVPEFKTRFPSCWFGEEFPHSTVNPASMRSWPIKHPTVKNVDAMKWIIQMSTNEGDLVLDPFCGSGTVLVAALETNRRAIGIEIDNVFCKLTLSRLYDCEEAY